MKSRAPLFICLAAALLLCPCAAKAAEERPLHIDVYAPFQPGSAVGLLMGPGGTRQVDAEVEEIAAGVYRVSFTVDMEKIEFGTTATALAVSKNGETAMGDVRSLSMAESGARPQACVEDVSVRGDSLSIYEKLIKLREERRNLIKQGVDKEFSNEVRDKLSTLERGFGLDTEPPLSSDLPPLLLLNRLGRLQEALREYVASRQKKPQ